MVKPPEYYRGKIEAVDDVKKKFGWSGGIPFPKSISEFDTNLDKMMESLVTSRNRLPAILSSVRIALIGLTMLLFLSQIPPIYSSYQLLKNDQNNNKDRMDEE